MAKGKAGVPLGTGAVKQAVKGLADVVDSEARIKQTLDRVKAETR